MDRKHMPIRPSAGNWVACKPVEYCVQVAEPIIWSFAYGETYECSTAKEKKTVVSRTFRPEVVMTSVYCSPLTFDPSP
jgi:hypothetical protein